MTRALAITWLFAGLRSNENVRLRLGCIRWQRMMSRCQALAILCQPTPFVYWMFRSTRPPPPSPSL